MTNEKLLILDGHSLMNRAFYALPELTNDEGLHTNAVYGFINMLFKMKEEINPDYIVCTFDRSVPTFRHKQYDDYKAGRKKMPSELAEQFPILKEILGLLSINTFEIDGFEADDLMGTLSVFAENKGIQVYIVTGDRDLLQLASDNINIVITKRGITEKEIYDRNRMIEQYGVTPTEFIDVKGLMGDSSDNIPGVPGIGEKTAFKLIKKYKSLENVLENIENIKGKKLKENLNEYREQAVFSKKLATIMINVPVEIDLQSIESKDDYDALGLKNIFEKLQFKSLINKIPGLDVIEKAEQKELNLNFEIIDSIDKFQNAVDKILEYNGKYILYFNFEICNGGSYSKSYIENIFINIYNDNYVINMKSTMDEDNEKSLKLLKKIFESMNIKKVGYDIKSQYSILDKLGLDLTNIEFDVKIASYLLNPSKGKYVLKDMIKEYIGVDLSEEDSEFKIKETFLLSKLHMNLDKKISDLNMKDLLYKIELPLTRVLSSMECEGFRVDLDKLNELGEKFKIEIEKVKTEIYALSEEEFNINSPKQLGKILFEKLDLPVIKKTKTGYSTNAQVLEKLIDKSPIIEKIIYYRQLTKIYSTYIEGLKSVIDDDGKIHSNFNQTVTATGRLSSTEPNLQNIPIKYEMGKEIRKVFIPENDDCIILSADYSQIELRVLAHIADDENLINAFKHHSDIHTKTASEVFNIPIDKVTKTQRSNAKAVNFGIIYGIGDFSLAKDLHISRAEAKNYIETYLERYPNVRKYMEDIVDMAKNQGYVTTIMNRRRAIKEIRSSNKIVRSLGERLAMNTPIQGSAADIIKIAMINVYNKLREKNLKSKVILQVHDELILNLFKDELDVVRNIVKTEMENAVSLKVPLEVDINSGDNWYEIK
ncbi:DNA polymerase I [Clostridium tyrobutyricum]|jgi:DNA polymerase-1|uniref:DNA polymerase I n=1 Tax=Clostridium tyrobutyricum DIVETGP TaxID=1408889 RepID=W6N8S2_CLOTY|nr:DNA polymerase I [Clostridium tyrobutyricum]AND85722.1 DNA polymerase [Clostridium tyrobutyricum]ANP70241.1 DNA polymerase I [Clostridium tyrobutyricum]MBV4414992.1 DNA polymerase I [Clostridium tyrobutyricum]MBV4421182.1 DNA polymerase I [Clostridium tyrobutyricum]MBV4434669.1 DNA polymerase I [Clostridium tyrobutyricum]